MSVLQDRKDDVQDTVEREVVTEAVSSGRSMTRRVMTAVLGILLCLFALFTTLAWPVLLLAIAVGVIGFAELVRIAGLEDRPLAGVLIGLLCYVSPVVVAWATKPGTWPFWAVIWLAYVIGCVGVFQGLRRGYSTPMSAAWLGAPLATVLVTHQQTTLYAGPTVPSYAPNAALMLLLPLWVGDTAALFVGKAFGRHKLAPSISPNKTWEGAAGNFVGCVVTACIVGHLLHISPVASVLVGSLSGILGQIGDLLQSALKRVSGLKDSGGVLPGHGGILDRMDSFLLASVPCATLMWLLDPQLYRYKLWP